MSQFENERKVALDAICKAAVVCKNVQQKIDVSVLNKEDKSPVTIADFAAQAIVCKALSEAFPMDPVIGEEDSASLREDSNKELLLKLTQEVNAVLQGATCEDVLSWIDVGGQKEYCKRFWTLDPIDGTKGFLRKDQYAISLALIVDGEIVVGALCCPNLKTSTSEDGAVFIAVKGEGAFERSLSNSKEAPIGVSKEREKQNIRTCESVEKAHSSHSDSARIGNLLGITAKPVRIDSQAKYATVARGDAEAYLRLPRDGKYREKIWDHAGGVLVVSEAGGTVTDIFGKPLDFTKGYKLENNMGVIVTSGTFHDDIIGAIKELNIGQFD